MNSYVHTGHPTRVNHSSYQWQHPRTLLSSSNCHCPELPSLGKANKPLGLLCFGFRVCASETSHYTNKTVQSCVHIAQRTESMSVTCYRSPDSSLCTPSSLSFSSPTSTSTAPCHRMNTTCKVLLEHSRAFIKLHGCHHLLQTTTC